MSVRSLIVLLLAALAAPLGACEAEVTRAILHLARHAPVGAEPAGGAPDVLDGPDSAPAADASHDGGGPDEPADVADTASPADVGLEDLPPEPPPPLAVVLPRRLALPWVPADGRPSELNVPLTFSRFPDETSVLDVTLSGAPALRISALDLPGPQPPGPGSAAVGSVALRFDGAAALTRATATLTIRLDGVPLATAEVHAFAGSRTDPLPATSWGEVSRAGVRHGLAATVRLATSPFPHPSGPWTDDRVHVFVPDGHARRAATDFVVHFHGHGATLAETLAMHRYREQLWASGSNQILVLPQGPVEAASGNFGRLMSAPGLVHLLDDVSALLYRDGHVLSPEVGDLTLTEHSGGYLATAANLGVVTGHGQVTAAVLLDGLYGRSAEFQAFARAGGFLRSNHTAGGGTRANNLALLNALGALGTPAFTASTLRDRVAVVWPTTASHHDATWWNLGYGEALRWASPRARRGPRVELRRARVVGGEAEMAWLAPDDDHLEAFVVETSVDGDVFDAMRLGPDARAARVPLPAGQAGLHVRVRTSLDDLSADDTLPSDTVFVGPQAPSRRVLVVDGFDRLLDGSFGGLSHDGAARVGAALEGAEAATNEAVVEGEVALSDYDAVIWLLGDESMADQTFSASERAVVEAYLADGGRVVVSGSEVAWELGSRAVAPAFLAMLGATFRADDAGADSVRGVGPLAPLGAVSFGGAGAPYPEDFPDVLGLASGAVALLSYPDGAAAAVGLPGRAALVAFPLELVMDTGERSALLAGLLGFVGL